MPESDLNSLVEKVYRRIRRAILMAQELRVPQDTERSATPVEVIIPVIDKDLWILPLTIAGVKKNLAHPIKSISLVAPKSSTIVETAAQLGCQWIDENSVLPIEKSEIRIQINGLNRSGWIFQQLIKLSETISHERFYFVIDADTILNKCRRFRVEERTCFLNSDEFHKPYHRGFQQLLGYSSQCTRSFVAHQMLFEKPKVRLLQKEIEERWQMPWYAAILQMLEQDAMCSFSEYETYANWHLRHFPEETHRRYWGNINSSEKQLLNPKWPRKILIQNAWSVSVHSYQR